MSAPWGIQRSSDKIMVKSVLNFKDKSFHKLDNILNKASE